MIVSRENECPHIKGNKLKYIYLGNLISSDGRNNTEITSRIAQAKKSFQRMKSILTNNDISIHTRRAMGRYINLFWYVDARLRDFKTTTKETGGYRNVVP